MAVRNGTKHGRPKYQFFPDLPPEEYESLKADVAVHGIQYAVIEDEKGNTFDGHQREWIADELFLLTITDPQGNLPGWKRERARSGEKGQSSIPLRRSDGSWTFRMSRI